MMVEAEAMGASGETLPIAPISETSISALEAADLRYFRPNEIELFRHGASLRLTVREECTYLNVTPARAFPLSDPEKYVTLWDGDGKEIGIISDPGLLDKKTRLLLHEALARRYVVPVLERLIDLKERFGTLEWNVVTNRGERRFTTRYPRENSIMLSPNRYLITDVEGNRYEISSLVDLDTQGRLMRYL